MDHILLAQLITDLLRSDPRIAFVRMESTNEDEVFLEVMDQDGREFDVVVGR